jgi:predicted nucleic acid-binding protein
MSAAEAGRRATPAFLDTNVFVYSFSGQDDAKRTVARSLAEAPGAWVSTQVLSELARVLTRRFGVAPREVRERVASIAAACEVVQVTPAIILDALRIMETYRYGFFDAQLISAALASGAGVLYTEDLHDGQIIDGSLKIRSPFTLRAEQRPRRYRVKTRRTGSASQGAGR